MKFAAEYRNQEGAERFALAIQKTVTRPWTLMEVCGGQTHAIVRFGLDLLLPKSVRLIHGPGCPICVTPTAWIDKALEIAMNPKVIFSSFGDMLRVPGSHGDLFHAKSKGADIRIVYSPLDALKLAQSNPDREVVFFAVGFETTAPTTAMAVEQARCLRIPNFSLLTCHVLVPPAIEALLSSPNNQVQAFLAAGHVCAVMGYEEYEPICRKYHVPIIVTGFEPLDILEGVYLAIKQLEEGRYVAQNQYLRAVKREGNRPAQELIGRVFQVVTRPWRGMGDIPNSGLSLSEPYRGFDAEARFGKVRNDVVENAVCISGEILQGRKRPDECPAFGGQCQPDQPLGATMVSSEGACAAYYRYRKPNAEVRP